jgi:hypothetical protein
VALLLALLCLAAPLGWLLMEMRMDPYSRVYEGMSFYEAETLLGLDHACDRHTIPPMTYEHLRVTTSDWWGTIEIECEQGRVARKSRALHPIGVIWGQLWDRALHRAGIRTGPPLAPPFPLSPPLAPPPPGSTTP